MRPIERLLIPVEGTHGSVLTLQTRAAGDVLALDGRGVVDDVVVGVDLEKETDGQGGGPISEKLLEPPSGKPQTAIRGRYQDLRGGPGVDRIQPGPREDLLYLVDSTHNRIQVLFLDFIQEIPEAGSPIRGSADAPVTVAVFTDFQ